MSSTVMCSPSTIYPYTSSNLIIMTILIPTGHIEYCVVHHHQHIHTAQDKQEGAHQRLALMFGNCTHLIAMQG